MGTFTKRDIVLFPFPYTDLSNRKLRPCLVLSETMGEDIMLCQITSQNIIKDKYSIILQKRDTENGSLMIDSYIRANMIFTADSKQIKRKVCEISLKKYDEIIETINKIIAI